MHPFVRFIQADKVLPLSPSWATPEGGEYAFFDLALEVEGVVEKGFVLHGGCAIYRPGCHVTFELRVGKKPGGRIVPLARVDWKSLDGHTNQRRYNTPLSGERLAATHYHSFDLNWLADRQRMRGPNLNVATNIDETLDDYDNFIVFVGKEFRIRNIELLPMPPWQQKLL